MDVRDPFSKSGLFDRSLRRILRPLVRALIAQGMTAPGLYRIIKQTYVDVAEQDLGSEATDSRINVMTGVHRRDVKEFRNRESDDDKGVGQKVSILSTVIGRWMSDVAYQGASGPIDLARSGETLPNFETLVQSVSRDIRPRTVLDELVRQKIVMVENDTVHLLLEGLVGSGDTDQKLHFFSHNLGDHMRAAVDNLLLENPPHLERAVFYNHLDPSSVARIEKEARAISADALRKINALAASHQDQDVEKGDASHRFRFGVFFYHEDEDAEIRGTRPDADQ